MGMRKVARLLKTQAVNQLSTVIDVMEVSSRKLGKGNFVHCPLSIRPLPIAHCPLSITSVVLVCTLCFSFSLVIVFK